MVSSNLEAEQPGFGSSRLTPPFILLAHLSAWMTVPFSNDI